MSTPGQGTIKTRRCIATLIFLAVGLGVTALVYYEVRQSQHQKVRESFDHEADELLFALEARIGRSGNSVHFLDAYIAGNEHVTLEQFRNFFHVLTAADDGLRTIVWLPVVKAANRTTFENRMASEIHADFRILEPTADGGMVPAGDRDWYAPVLFVEPAGRRSPVIGFDARSNALRRDAMERSSAEKRMVFTERIQRVEYKTEPYGVLGFLPVFNSGDADTVDGYVVCLVSVAELANDIDHMRPQLGTEMQVTILDLSAPVDRRMLYSTYADETMHTEEMLQSLPHRTTTVDAGGRRWALYATIDAAALEVPPSRAAWSALIAGVALSLLATGYLRRTFDVAEEIDQLVHTRTGELARTNTQLHEAIDAQKRVERELTQERERLQAILDSTVNTVMIVGTDGKIREANHATETMFGYSQAELIGMTATETLEAEFAKEYTNYLRRYNEDGFREVLGRGLEAVSRRKDGSLFQSLITMNEAAIGPERCFVVVVTDITKQRDVERERDQFFMLSQDLLCIADEANVLRRVSPSWTHITGLSAFELTRRSFIDLLHPADQATGRGLLESLRHGGELVAHPLRLMTADGESRWIAWSATWVAEQKLLFATGQDFEEQRRAGQQLDHLLQELASANNRLQQANRELSTFAHIISHDLKAPLRGISTVADWLRNDHGDSLSPDGQKLVDMLVERGQSLNTLIDGVLHYSRTALQDGEEIPIDLGEAAREAVAMLQVPSGITIDIAPDLPTISGTRARLQQVFLNLISNAISACDPEHGQISVTYEETRHERRVVVADNGPGVPPEHHERIFQLFQSAKPAAESRDSTGIGLAVVRTVMLRCGGSVHVESEDGAGARFVLVLPPTSDARKLANSESYSMVDSPPTTPPAAT